MVVEAVPKVLDLPWAVPMPYILQPGAPSNWVKMDPEAYMNQPPPPPPPPIRPIPMPRGRRAPMMGTCSPVKTMHPLPTVLNIVPDDAGDGEVIEAQILPQDDNWGDNTTAITSLSGVGSHEDFHRMTIVNEAEYDIAFGCQRYGGTVLAALLSLVAFVSPVAMVVLPTVGVLPMSKEKDECGAECDGLLIAFTFKLLILLLGTWALFFRAPRATMPRIFTFRSLVLSLLFLVVFAFWLFYGVRFIEQRDTITYYSILHFSSCLVDTLLFIHYAALLLIELKHLQPQYQIKVVRSPDGESHSFCIGQLSIQRAAVFVLQQYYANFSVFNPFLEQLPLSKSQKKAQMANSSFKYYDVDGLEHPSECGKEQPDNTSRRKDSAHNERFYEEHEYERRVKKRQARLITAAEEAFTHIRRLNERTGPGIPALDSYEAAQAIFPSFSRPLQKYLRITRQQPQHTMDYILNHLSTCLTHGLSPRTFLEKFITRAPVLQNEKEHKDIQTWALVCDTLLSRPISDGAVFLLRQGDASLLCTVTSLPHFNITEQVIHPKRNKFLLRVNSETSV